MAFYVFINVNYGFMNEKKYASCRWSHPTQTDDDFDHLDRRKRTLTSEMHHAAGDALN
jgi:hypothetical protein